MWKLALALLVLLLAGPASAVRFGGGGSSSPSSDPLVTLIHNMANNSFALISSQGAGTDGYLGIANDQLSCATNNGTSYTLFDGSTNADGSYNGNITFNSNVNTGAAGPINPYSPCYGPAIGVGNWTDPSFSSQTCDVAARICGLWSGGHTDGGDGSVAFFNINTAILNCIDAPGFPVAGSNGVCPIAGRGHWAINPTLYSMRYIPMANPPPAIPVTGFDGDNYFTFSATFTVGSTTMTTVPTAVTTVGNKVWISGPGIVPFTITTGCGSNYECDSPIAVACPTSYQVSGSCFSSNETNVTVGGIRDYWAVPNAAGTLLPMIVHAYWADFIIPGTTKMLLGGSAVFAGNPDFGSTGAGFIVDYSTQTVSYLSPSAAAAVGLQLDFQGAPCYDPVGNNLVGSTTFNIGGSGVIKKGPTSGIVNLAAGLTTSIGSMPVAGDVWFNQLICMQDPINGAGHEMIFQESDDGNAGGFAVILDIDGTPVESTHTYSGGSNFAATGNSNRKWIPSTDGTFMYVWEGGAKIYKMTTGSNLDAWSVSEIDGGTATGALPQRQGAAEQALNGYDLGPTYCHAALLVTAGDIYIYRPPGCSL